MVVSEARIESWNPALAVRLAPLVTLAAVLLASPGREMVVSPAVLARNARQYEEAR